MHVVTFTQLDSIEEPYLLHKAVDWQDNFQNKYPSRTCVVCMVYTVLNAYINFLI